MEQPQIEVFYPENASAWREWLQNNHLSQQAVWLVFHTKASQKHR